MRREQQSVAPGDATHRGVRMQVEGGVLGVRTQGKVVAGQRQQQRLAALRQHPERGVYLQAPRSVQRLV